MRDVGKCREVDGEMEDAALGAESLVDIFWFVIGNEVEKRGDAAEKRLEVERGVEHHFVCDETATKPAHRWLSGEFNATFFKVTRTFDHVLTTHIVKYLERIWL